jgi:2-amino-4-hydroxy-6-hydroxymethyldihydropteridine diphosphokinase
VRATEPIATAPLAGLDQPEYLNGVAEISTDLAPHELLNTLKQIEGDLGREKTHIWGSRIIDLDILLIEDEIIASETLTVPHPEMHLRSFVLRPLSELAPNLVHPTLGRAVAELAKRLNGQDFHLDAGRAQLISVAGIIGVGKTTLARILADTFGCPLLREPYDKNPFLRDVYAGKAELALDSELFFLVTRADQLSPESLSPGRPVVSDYLFENSLLYPRHWLRAHQLRLYNKIYDRLAPTVTRPALVIYLEASVETCLGRIHRRNRRYEQKIQPDFLEALSADYRKLFANWSACPVIALATDNCDYRKGEHRADLLNQVQHYITGTEKCSTKPQYNRQSAP